ncbi:MAG: FecR domain-containing protein [Acetobacteraceae bacterium]|nr:FecR domain-containing protein [Acetobacteraceae bacterium]
MRHKTVGMLLAVVGLTLRMGAAPAATLAGTVAAVDGLCTAQGRALRPGDAIQVGDTIGVPANGNLRLQMRDGSRVLVAPGSSVTVASYSVGGAGRSARLSLPVGLLRAVVAPVPGPSAFEISTAAGTAAVRSRSADAFVKVQGGLAQVGVLAGTVALTSAATGRSVSIPAHWGTRLEPGLNPMLPRVWAQTEFNAVIRLTQCCQSGQPR